MAREELFGLLLRSPWDQSFGFHGGVWAGCTYLRYFKSGPSDTRSFLLLLRAHPSFTGAFVSSSPTSNRDNAAKWRNLQGKVVEYMMGVMAHTIMGQPRL